jgi:hypothetical protein
VHKLIIAVILNYKIWTQINPDFNNINDICLSDREYYYLPIERFDKIIIFLDFKFKIKLDLANRLWSNVLFNIAT